MIVDGDNFVVICKNKLHNRKVVTDSMAYTVKAKEKTRAYYVRVTESEYEKLQKVIKKLKISQADFTRHALTKELNLAVSELF